MGMELEDLIMAMLVSESDKNLNLTDLSIIMKVTEKRNG